MQYACKDNKPKPCLVVSLDPILTNGALQPPSMPHHLVRVFPKKGITWQIIVNTMSPLPVFPIPVQGIVMMFCTTDCNKGNKDVNVPSPKVWMPAEWVMPFP